MHFSELIQLYFERSNALQNYWTVYVVVIGGLLAFSSLRKDPDLVTTTLLTILFSMFAYKNLGAIQDVTMQRLAVLESIKQEQASATSPTEAKSAQALLILPTLNPPQFEGVKQFHIASDFLTILILWAMERRRRRLNPCAKA